MSISGDLYTQNFSTIQTEQQPKPTTVTAAATLTPSTKMTFVDGQTQVANITPPDPYAYCEVTLCFLHAAPGAFLTNGTAYPIKVAYQPIQNRPIDLCWDPISEYWWPKAVV